MCQYHELLTSMSFDNSQLFVGIRILVTILLAGSYTYGDQLKAC
jgi:hypothetical protein